MKEYIGDNMEIAIIGMAAKFSMASNIYEFWNNLLYGRDCVTECPEERKPDIEEYLDFCGIPEDKRNYRMASFLDHIDYFDYEFFHISPKEAKLMDPYQRLLLQTSYNSIEDAGYSGDDLATKKVGIYTGFPTEYTSKVYQNIIMDTNPILANESFSGNLVAMLPARLAYFLDLHGPTYVIDTSCSSSLTALHLACQGIKTGDCEMAIANGINIFTIPLLNDIVGGIGILSPDGRARSFDDDCEGVGQGEGVGAVLLKPLTQAIKDNDHIYAVIKSTAANQDGKSIGITAPNASAQEAVIMEAWDRAEIDPNTISYIEAHGTATKLGDPTEIKGINRAFRHYTERNQFCGIGSVKSNIGHTLGAAGIASVIKMALSLENKKIPPSIHFNKPNQRISFETSSIFVNDRVRLWDTEEIRRCGISSFGITGTNCHIVMEEAPRNIIPRKNRKKEIFTVSANHTDVLMELIESYIDFIRIHEKVDLIDICNTVNSGRKALKYKIAIVCDSNIDLINKLLKIKEKGFEACDRDEYERESIFISLNCYGLDEEFVSENTQLEELVEYAKNYVNTDCMNWNGYYGEGIGNRISLPVYPFKKTRCWISIPKKKYNDKINKMVYKPIWISKEYECRDQKLVNDDKKYLVFSNGETIISEFIERLKKNGLDVIEVQIGSEYMKSEENFYVIRNDISDFRKLFESLDSKKIGHVVYGIYAKDESIENEAVIGLFNVGKSIQEYVSHTVRFTLITQSAYRVDNNETSICPMNAALIGMLKTMKWEIPNLRCHCIDLDDKRNADNIIREIQGKIDDFIVSYRRGNRYVERIEQVELEKIDSSGVELKTDKAYVFFGGTGRIGRKIASYFSQKNKLKLVLVHRSVLPQREDWEPIIKKNQDDDLVFKLKELIDIEKKCESLELVRCDITNENEVTQLLLKIREKYSGIRGIIQCAVDDTPLTIKDLSEEELKRALKAKINSTNMISKSTERDGLDFFLTFSSVMTLVGGVGTASYMASNSYLEAFSQSRTIKGYSSQVISWPEWLNIGLSENLMNSEDTSIFRKIEKDTGLQMIEMLLGKKLDRVVVGEIQKDSKIYDVIDYLPFKYSDRIINELKNKNNESDSDIEIDAESIDVKLIGRKTGLYSEEEMLIGQSICKVMGYESLDIHANFFELGGDSISAVKISVDLEDKNIIISAPDILRYQTLEKMAEFVKKQG